MSLPEGWKKTNLVNCLESLIDYRGKTPKKSESGILTLSAKSVKMGYVDYNQAYYISPEEYNKFMVRGFPKKGDVLMTTEAPLGYIAKLDRDNISVAQRLLTLRGKDKVLDNDYLLYYLTSRQGQHELHSRASGSTVQGIKRSEFEHVEIILPKSYEEQKAIANILSSFDEKIELLKEQNETLEEMAQGVFREWLSQNNNEDWEYKELDDVLDISSSKRIFAKEYVEDGIPFYRSKEIIELSKKPNITTELFITEERFQEIKNNFSAPTKGDILLTSVGTLGISYQVRDNKPFYFKDGNLTWFKNFSDYVSSNYVFLWLKLKSTQNKLNEVSIGSTQKALTISSLKTLEIPVLKDKNKAKELFEFIKIQLDKVNYNYEQIQTLQKIRDTLLPKLMSGELRVEGFGE